MVGICPGGIWHGGLLSGGYLSGGICPGFLVLEPIPICCVCFASLDVVCDELNDCAWNLGM